MSVDLQRQDVATHVDHPSVRLQEVEAQQTDLRTLSGGKHCTSRRTIAPTQRARSEVLVLDAHVERVEQAVGGRRAHSPHLGLQLVVHRSLQERSFCNTARHAGKLSTSVDHEIDKNLMCSGKSRYIVYSCLHVQMKALVRQRQGSSQRKILIMNQLQLSSLHFGIHLVFFVYGVVVLETRGDEQIQLEPRL